MSLAGPLGAPTPELTSQAGVTDMSGKADTADTAGAAGAGERADLRAGRPAGSGALSQRSRQAGPQARPPSAATFWGFRKRPALRRISVTTRAAQDCAIQLTEKGLQGLGGHPRRQTLRRLDTDLQPPSKA
jgi:hypothetical protein